MFWMVTAQAPPPHRALPFAQSFPVSTGSEEGALLAGAADAALALPSSAGVAEAAGGWDAPHPDEAKIALADATIAPARRTRCVEDPMAAS